MTAGRMVAGLALTLVALTGCSDQGTQGAMDDVEAEVRDEAQSAIEQADLPEVNWDKYSTDLQERLDDLAANVDCSALEEEMAKMEANDAEVTEYIKAQLEQLDC